jgi:peptidoglycan/LPS O-acetylase OafA/YrhL
MEFREDINGLRAIAVITVVVFHFSPSLLPGGFIGVDVFFVISGYLMTRIIWGRIDDKSFNIFQFYKARLKRIVPALVVMAFIVTLYLWHSLYDAEFQQYLKHLFSSLLFFSNVVYWQESGYFSASAHENWLLHTWSLSVEWQFYIIYPIILSFLSVIFTKKVMGYLLLLAALASYLLSIYATFVWPDPAYFSLPTRAWQMLAGALVFFFPLPKKYQFSWMPLIGIGVILCCSLYYFSGVGWPGYHGIFPVLGACIILYSGEEHASILLNNTFMQNIGKWSYSIYLWHWPIVVFIYNQSFTVHGYHLVLGILVSIILGYLSFIFIEQTKHYRAKLILFLTTLAFSNFAFSFSIGATSLRPISADPSNTLVTMYARMQQQMQSQAKKTSCRLSEHLRDDGEFTLPKKCLNLSGEGGVMVWGDSHAEAISRGFQAELLPENIIVSSGCRPSFNQPVGNSSKLRVACDTANSLAKTVLVEANPSVVIVAMKNNHELVDWHNSIRVLKAHGVDKIIVIGPTPQFYPSLPLVYARENPSGVSLSTRKLDTDLIVTDKIMEELLNTYKGVDYVSLIKKLCFGEGAAMLCTVKIEGTLISFDYGHLHPHASVYLSNKHVLPLIKSK